MKVIDFEVTIENTNDDIKKLYQIVRPEVKLDDIKLSEFKEGVVNSIVKADDPVNNDPLVIRTYTLKIMSARKDSDEDSLDISKFQNRKLEIAALKEASDRGITVKLIATYTNGFIYKFIDGEINSVKLYNLEVAKKTAIKMARLHKIELKGLASEKSMLSKFEDQDIGKGQNEKFDKIQAESEHEEFRTVIPMFSVLNEENERLFKILRDNDAFGKLCFCHNDLNLTNLIIEKSTKDPIFIDFEWSDTCYSLYDISYHLYCMGGLFCQYFNPEDVPDEEFIKKWLTFYYEESHRLDGIKMSNKELNDFIDNEVKKVRLNMIYIAIQLIIRGMYFAFDFSKNQSTDSIKNFCLAVYKDFVKRKEDLKLLETIKK